MLPLDLYLAVAHNSLTTFLMATSISMWGSKSLFLIDWLFFNDHQNSENICFILFIFYYYYFFNTPIIGELSAHSVGK